MATQTLLSHEEFRALPEREGVKLELDEGKLIEMPTPSFLHGTVQATVSTLLRAWVHQTGADFYLSQATGFLLHPDTERAPDVCLVRKSSFAAMEKVRGALRGAPDLAVEVVSPSDTAEDMDRRTDQYLRAGTTSVWFLYPETRHVMIYRRSGEIRRLASGERIQEPELLPGLEIPVDEIFAGIEELKK